MATENNNTFDDGRGRQVVPTPHKAVRVGFGIFMIIIYVGMGLLMCFNFFSFEPSWDWARWIIGIGLILYGLFRAYRQFSGSDYYSK